MILKERVLLNSHLSIMIADTLDLPIATHNLRWRDEEHSDGSEDTAIKMPS